MPHFLVKYHVVGVRCCGRKPLASQTMEVEVDNIEAVLSKVRETIPSARIESIEEIS